MKKIIIGDRVIFEQKADGTVPIDDRIVAALEDGRLKRLRFYDLSSAEKEEVIKVLKKLNAVNVGLEQSKAEEWRRHIVDKVGYRTFKNSPSKELDVNGEVVYRTDSRNRVIKDLRVEDATKAALIEYVRGDYSLSALDNYGLTDKQYKVVKKHLLKYIRETPMETDEDKRKFLAGSELLSSQIETDLIDTKPAPVHASTNTPAATSDLNQPPTTGIKNFDAFYTEFIKALLNKKDINKVFTKYDVNYDKESTILKYAEYYAKANPINTERGKARFIKYLPELKKYTEHALKGHPLDIDKSKAFKFNFNLIDKDITEVLKHAEIKASEGKDPIAYINSTPIIPDSAKHETSKLYKEYIKKHPVNAPGATNKFYNTDMGLLAKEVIYGLNGNDNPHGTIPMPKIVSLVNDGSTDYAIALYLGLSPNSSLYRHSLKEKEIKIIKKHFNRYLEKYPLNSDANKPKFLHDLPKIKEKIIEELKTGKDEDAVKSVTDADLLKNVSKYTHIAASALMNGKDPGAALQNEGLTTKQQYKILTYFNKYNTHHPLTKSKWRNHLAKVVDHITLNTKHMLEGHEDDIKNDEVYLPPMKDYNTTSSFAKIRLVIRTLNPALTDDELEKDIASGGGLDTKTKNEIFKQVKKFRAKYTLNPNDDSEVNGLTKQVIDGLNADSVPHAKLTQNEYIDLLKNGINDVGWNFGYSLDIDDSLNRHRLTDKEKNVINKHLLKEYNKLKGEHLTPGTKAWRTHFQNDYPSVRKEIIDELLKDNYKDAITKKAVKKDFNNKLKMKDTTTKPVKKDDTVKIIKSQEKAYINKHGIPLKKKQKTIKFKPEPKLITKTLTAPKNMLFSLSSREAYNVRHDDVPVKDSDWVTNVFALGKQDLDTVVREAMFWTSAEMKLVDTSLGGNTAINNTPQFTRTADIRVMGLRTDRQPVKMETITGNHGMGRYYSEKIDDNTVKCFMKFGVPEFNGIFTFLTSAVDYESAVVANSGRSPLAYKAGHAVGSFAFFAAFPVLALVYWIGKEIADIVLGPGNFEFYYMKETMPKYWSIVNSLVMMMSTELGLVLPTFNTESNSGKIGAPLKLSKEDMAYFHMFMPEAITKEGYLNIMAVVTRTQRSINKYLKQQYKTIKTDGSIQHLQQLVKESQETRPETPTPYHKYWEDVKKKYDGPMYRKSKKKKSDGDKGKSNGKDDKKTKANNNGTFDKKVANFKQNAGKYFENFKEATIASMDGGAEHAIFNVEYLGSSSMSVSNEVGELEIEGILKGLGGKARAIRYSGAEGILGAVGDIAKYATDAAVGAIDGMTLNIPGKVLTLLLGDANLSLPKRWMDSNISLPTHSFKMKLISPYGNPMSQLINIYVPLASIMAGALPLATGMSSYTSPFLTSIFVRGYQNIPMGMITSLEITKGTSNLPFNQTWKPMAVDVTFTVTDFSQILALPVGHDMFSMANVIYDDNNPLNRYVQALCGRDFYSTTFLLPKLKMRLSRIVDNVTVMVKPETLGMQIGDTLRPIGRLLPWHTELGQYTQRD